MQPASTSSLLQFWCLSVWCFDRLTCRLCRVPPTCTLLSGTFALKTCLSRSLPCSDAQNLCLAFLPLLASTLGNPWSDIGKLQLHWLKLWSAVSSKHETLQQVKDPYARTPFLQPVQLWKPAANQARQKPTVGLQLYCAEHAVQLNSCSQVQVVSAETSHQVMPAALVLLLM